MFVLYGTIAVCFIILALLALLLLNAHSEFISDMFYEYTDIEDVDCGEYTEDDMYEEWWEGE